MWVGCEIETNGLRGKHKRQLHTARAGGYPAECLMVSWTRNEPNLKENSVILVYTIASNDKKESRTIVLTLASGYSAQNLTRKMFRTSGCNATLGGTMH